MVSKQPLEARLRKERLRSQSQLVLPAERDPRQLWLLVRQEPSDRHPGCFFVTHGANFKKFNENPQKPGFQVLAHSYDRMALTAAARRATLVCGPSYQPKFSAHAQGPDFQTQAEGADDFNELPANIEVPTMESFLNSLPDSQA